MKKFLPDKFVLTMLCIVLLAFLFPYPASPDFFIDLTLVTQIGIALVFFLHGANLEPSKLVASLKNWKAHGLTQATTFILFPVLGLAIYYSTGDVLAKELRLGIFFLTALPSTISSSIAMTALARGSVPVAVFNATLSSLFGMIVTPTLIALVSTSALGNMSLLSSVQDIAQTLLAPFILGQLARPIIKKVISKHKWILNRLDRGVILLIIYVSFAKSTIENVWSQFSAMQFGLTAIIVLTILALTITTTTFLARKLNLSLEDEIAAVFCGSTKSLANGAPIAQILFAGSPQLALIMLPLMLYHQLQLIACATLARKYADKAIEAES